MTRKVFLEDIPTKEGRGANKGKQITDWINSIGCNIGFIYDGLQGEFGVVDYDRETENLTILYKSDLYKINSTSLKKCRIGRVIGKHTNEFKVKIGTHFKDDKRDLITIDREYRERKRNNNEIEREKYYKYKCNVCGWEEGWIFESNLLKGVGCSCCASSTTVLGINTIWDTDRWMCDLGVSEEDAKKYTSGSHDYIMVKCLKCNKEKEIKIYSIRSSKSIGCSCGDGFSYPEKFMFSVLEQLGIEFKTQLTKTTFEWCDNKRYDFYIPCYDIIIETHGMQHYEYTGLGQGIKKEQENDRVKKDVALENEIKHYVTIDCRYSEVDYIKNSILNSELSNLFDLSNIDWVKCEEYSLGDMVKEVCKMYNECEDTTYILENNRWGVNGRNTIIRYLRKGTELGYCDYVGKKKEVEVFKDGKSLGIFESARELERQSEELFGFKLDFRPISSVARGNKPQYKGFTFKYL